MKKEIRNKRFCESYDEFYQPRVRSVMRSSVLSVLAGTIAREKRYDELALVPRIQHLCLHHLFDDEESSFHELIGWLSKDYSFASYSESIEKMKSDSLEKAYVSLSFDDGFRSCLRIARILKSYNISACFFICPKIIEEESDDAVVEYCLERLRTPPVRFMDRSGLESLKSLGHEIGYHTLSHVSLKDIDESQFEDELILGRQKLERWIGPIRHFAWPFGHYSDLRSGILDYIRDQDYDSIASAERGCHVPQSPFNSFEDIVLRDPWVSKWPISHLRYFFIENIRKAQKEAR